MKAIINNLLYDTEKAEKIYEYRRKVQGAEVLFMPGYSFYDWCHIDIYKTTSGRWFEHNTDKSTITPTTEADVKDTIRKINPEKYMELFGSVENA